MKLVKFKKSHKGLDYWASRPYVSEQMQGAVRQASILIVPTEGFRGHQGPLFPVGTDEMIAFLKSNAPPGVEVELPVADEDYQELALHGALIVIGTFVITAIAAPIFATLVSEAIKSRYPQYFSGVQKAEASIEVHVQRPDGSFFKVRWEGPATEIPDLDPVLRGIADGDDVPLLELDDEDEGEVS